MSNLPTMTAPAPTAPIIFALSPATVDSGILNYATKTGSDIYKTAIAKLSTQYSVNGEGLKTFINELQDRSTSSGWTSIVHPIDSKGDKIDLINRYGTITMDEVKTNCNIYIDTQSRDAQNSAQMYECIMNSIDEVGKKRTVNECEKYTILNVKSGPIHFKLITSKVIVDNRSTTHHLREQLSSLYTHIYEYRNHIITFNSYVQGLELALKARGHKIEDLNLNLFKGYTTCSDENFREYIEKKRMIMRMDSI